MITRREKLTSYLILGPFAIVLAFPFYWMLWTSFKTELDLYNVENAPFGFSKGSPTTRNYTFLFEETQYLTWVKNTVFVGLIVVVITLILAVPAGYALARLSGRWGQGLGVGIFLTYLVPPTLLFLPLSWVIANVGPPGPAALADPRLPVVHRAVLDLAADGLLQDDPAASWRRRPASTAPRASRRSTGSSSRSRSPGS